MAPVVEDNRAVPTPSTVDWFFRLPWLAYSVGSVGCCYWTWWINRPTLVNSFSGCFFSHLTVQVVLPWDMVENSISPLQTHFGPVFGDEAVQASLLFPE